MVNGSHSRLWQYTRRGVLWQWRFGRVSTRVIERVLDDASLLPEKLEFSASALGAAATAYNKMASTFRGSLHDKFMRLPSESTQWTQSVLEFLAY
jgi:hypothetical protein